MSENYQKRILNILLDRYERRGLYNVEKAKKAHSVTLDVIKEFSEYKNAFQVEKVATIDTTIEALVTRGVLSAKKDARGMYGMLRLNIPNIEDAYQLAQRTPIYLLHQKETVLLHQYESNGGHVLSSFCHVQLERLNAYKSVEFGIGEDYELLHKILIVLQVIENLDQETYIRNFSEAIFHDSKQFQKIRPTIEHILRVYGEIHVDPKRILEQYNLFDNPGYIFLKGQVLITYPTVAIDVAAVPGGLALPSRSLEQIQHITVTGTKVITIENLTTYHDTEDFTGGAILYLGGFMNRARKSFLQQTYQDNKGIPFFHKGDIDIYGFLILEHLKSSTSIPFQPLEMDLKTLQYCFSTGHYKSLTEQDKRAMQAPEIQPYKEILQFMLDHNCKVEQECFEAMKLSQRTEDDTNLL